MDSVAVEQMLEQGLAQTVSAGTLDDFLSGKGLRVLFFSGLAGNRTEGHDVAVALRELLRGYGGALEAGIVSGPDERALMPRFRVAVLPSLVLVSGGEVLEVLPRVRDWADYASALRRYLGPPGSGVQAAEVSA